MGWRLRQRTPDHSSHGPSTIPLRHPAATHRVARSFARHLTHVDIRVFVGRMRIPLVVAACAFVGGTLFGSGSTANAQCAPSASSESSPIAQELSAEAGRARTWRYVWTGINAGSMALSLAGIPILPKSETPALAVSAATAAVSGAFTWFWPLDVEGDAEMSRHLGCRPVAEREHELQRLREHSARDEASRIQWPWHVGNLVTAFIPGAILWFGFHRQLDGALATIGGFASGEIELLTQPTGLTIDPPTRVRQGARASVTSRSGLVTYTLVW